MFKLLKPNKLQANYFGTYPSVHLYHTPHWYHVMRQHNRIKQSHQIVLK